MQPVFNPPTDLTGINSLSLNIRLTTQCDGQEPNTVKVERNVVFAFETFEAEVIWQAIKAIIELHKGSSIEAFEAFDMVAEKLNSLRSPKA